MKKLKDFLYDYNDVLIAFGLLLIAALLIIWRMNAIIEYPKEMLSDNSPVSELSVDDEIADSSDDIKDDTASEESGQTSGQGSGDNSVDNSDQSAESQSSSELWVNGMLSKKLEVSVSGNSASAAVQCLIDAGLFDDYREYQDTCAKLGIDHEKIAAGTFVFEKGWTKSDIVDAVNWS